MVWLATHMWALLIAAFAVGVAVSWWVWGRLGPELDLARRDASDLRAGNETLRSQVDRLEPAFAAKQELESRLAALDGDLAAKTQALAKAESDAGELRRQLEGLETLRREAGEAPELRKRIEVLSKEKAQAEARIADLERSLHAAKAERDAAQAAAQRLSAEVSQLGEANRGLESRAVKAEGVAASAETGFADQRAALEARTQSLAQTAQAAEAARKGLEARIAKLGDQLRAEAGLRPALERRIAELQLRLDAVEADRTALRSKHKVLKTNMKMIVAAAEQNGAVLDRLRNELHQVSRATVQAEARASELVADIERARTDVKHAERDAEEMRRRWARAASVDSPTPAQPKLYRAPVAGAPDDLTRIAGVTADMQRRLQAIGVFYIGQVAGWSRGEAAWIDARLGGKGAAQAWADSARRLITSRPKADEDAPA